MIDYDKLKLAHELCRKLDGHWFRIDFCINIKEHDRINIFLYQCDANSPIIFINIDELINKLQELTHSKNRFAIGQEVWFIDSYDKISCLKIRAIEGKNPNIRYVVDNNGWSVHETYCYDSKQSLVEDQIKYWMSKLEVNAKDEQCYCGQLDSEGIKINKCGYCRQELCDHNFHYGFCVKCNEHID